MTAYAATMEQARRHSQSDCGSSAMSAVMRHASGACLILFVLLVLSSLGALELLGLVVVSILLVRVLADRTPAPAENKA